MKNEKGLGSLEVVLYQGQKYRLRTLPEIKKKRQRKRKKFKINSFCHNLVELKGYNISRRLLMENLYRKFRPKTWDEVLGNSENISQLKLMVEKKDRAHTYLFTGDSGCGKTTLARIFAKEIGADSLSIREVNMADNRGIDTMREIIEKMRYMPVSGKPLVYILDEFHRCTADAQSAMLKPFEDTPPHVYFILCTTDPGKILKTIQTRCTQIKVDPVDNRELYRYISDIALNKLNQNKSKAVIKAIMDSSMGSVRKALVLLEQVIGIEDEEAQLKIIASPSEESAQVIDLCRCLLKRNWKDCAKVLAALKEQKAEAENIRYAVLGYMQSVLLKSGDKTAGFVMECFSDDTYSTKFPGIVLMAFQACQGE